MVDCIICCRWIFSMTRTTSRCWSTALRIPFDTLTNPIFCWVVYVHARLLLNYVPVFGSTQLFRWFLTEMEGWKYVNSLQGCQGPYLFFFFKLIEPAMPWLALKWKFPKAKVYCNGKIWGAFDDLLTCMSKRKWYDRKETWALPRLCKFQFSYF